MPGVDPLHERPLVGLHELTNLPFQIGNRAQERPDRLRDLLWTLDRRRPGPGQDRPPMPARRQRQMVDAIAPERRAENPAPGIPLVDNGGAPVGEAGVDNFHARVGDGSVLTVDRVDQDSEARAARAASSCSCAARSRSQSSPPRLAIR